LHKRIRGELGFAEDEARDPEAMLNQGYRGSRYSFGYPTCPNLADQKQLLALLGPRRLASPSPKKTSSIPSNRPRPSSSTTRRRSTSQSDRHGRSPRKRRESGNPATQDVPSEMWARFGGGDKGGDHASDAGWKAGEAALAAQYRLQFGDFLIAAVIATGLDVICHNAQLFRGLGNQPVALCRARRLRLCGL
jgi:hypothetical protein